ncbi:hypothetical protein N5K35_24335 [Pseudomonas sp. GD03651]|uniref:hypothetical protein n=1 Tax=Pseudomonas sp. GD03651 TaxID=2975361 RepID=UPI002447EE83|nr:hypothetical protein [Pseudomonas sp. GD03651]MDH2186821.1 hypothetical protein [Pseudomonas sp. GD03651]
MRTIASDHTLFNECIEAFRSSGLISPSFMGMPGESYLLTDFQIVNEWELPNAIISASQRVDMPGPNAGFVSVVTQKDGGIMFGHHLFSTALASIVSFATGRLCKSPRDDFSNFMSMEADIGELALTHPIRHAGPGATDTNLSTAALNKHYVSTCNMVGKLLAIDKSKYIKTMQAIRLLHLAMINKKEDFGLSYLLIISAIEAIAQSAIKKKTMEKKHALEDQWSNRAKKESDFAEIFNAYKEASSRNSYLTDRYVAFIHNYCPTSTWESIIPEHNQDAIERDKERRESYGWITAKESHRPVRSAFEIYPSDLSQNELTQILKSSYKHRSSFVHEGRQPPHKTPNSSNRFFDELIKYSADNGDQKLETEMLPTHALMLAIARNSITNWIG